MKKLLIGLGLLITVAVFAATSYTTNYNLAKPSDGDTNWGSSYRDNMDTIDTQLFVGNGGLAAHLADTVGAHAATAISTSVGDDTCTSADDVQEFLDCLDAQVAGLSGGSGVFLLSENNTATGDNTFSGTSTFGDTVTFNGTVVLSGAGTGVVHTDGTGLLSSSSVVLTSEVSGVLPLANGGTNAALTATTGSVIYSTGTALAMSATGSTGQILRANGASAPTWSTATFPNATAATGAVLVDNGTNFTSTNINLADTDAVGATILPIANGGTNSSATATTGAVAYGTGTALAWSSTGTTGQALTSNGIAAPTFGTLGIAGGGTNSTDTATTGGVGYGTGTAHAYSAAGSTGTLLRSNGTAAPSFTTATYPNATAATGAVLVDNGTNFTSTNINLADTDAVGATILALANGGTNAALTAATGAVIYSTGTAFAVSATGTTGQLLQSNGAAAPTFITDTVIVSAHSATATVTSSPSDVTWVTEDQDNTASFGGITFTVPTGAGGTYSVDASIRMTATTIAIDNTFTLSVLKNGAIVATHFLSSGAITETKFIPHTFWQGALVATDTIKIQISSDATSAPVIVASTVSNLLAIRRVGN